MPNEPDQEPPWEILDIFGADRTMLRYKRGEITAEEAKAIVVRDCGIPPHIADKAIIETDETPLATLEDRIG